MAQKNRELSQFGSFLEVNNTNQNIGIATTATPYIGIGTINPQYKLHLVGDTNIDGTIYLNGTPLVDASLQPWIPDGFNIYRASGSVGIGTSVYSSKLTVLGDATFSDEVTASQFISSGIVTASGFISSGIVTASRFISTVTTGTSPFTVTSQTEVTNLNASFLRGKTPPSGSIVGTTDIQTLTNKTLTSPTITSIVNSGTKTVPTGTGTFVITGASGIVTSGMIADLSIVNADVSSSAAIAYSKLNLNGSIVNSDISVGAGISISKLSASTISGISLGSNLNNLTAGSYITYDSGSTYNGSTARTISVAATTLNTANTLVARDASGDFSAGDISCGNLTATFEVTSNGFKIDTNTVIDSNRSLVNVVNGNFSGIITATDGFKIGTNTVIDSNRSLVNVVNGNFSGIVTATDFNSTAIKILGTTVIDNSRNIVNVASVTSSGNVTAYSSDKRLKENFNHIKNPLEKVQKLNGYTFDWNKKSEELKFIPQYKKNDIGLIAQEVQDVLPQAAVLAPFDRKYEDDGRILSKSGENYLTIQYERIIPLLIEAMKEMKVLVDEQRIQINNLEELVSELKK